MSSVIVLGLLGFGLGALAGRDLAGMVAGLMGPGRRIAVSWRSGKRLALFLACLALAARHGPAGVLMAAAGYLAGFAVLVVKGKIALGR